LHSRFRQEQEKNRSVATSDQRVAKASALWFSSTKEKIARSWCFCCKKLTSEPFSAGTREKSDNAALGTAEVEGSGELVFTDENRKSRPRQGVPAVRTAHQEAVFGRSKGKSVSCELGQMGGRRQLRSGFRRQSTEYCTFWVLLQHKSAQGSRFRQEHGENGAAATVVMSVVTRSGSPVFTDDRGIEVCTWVMRPSRQRTREPFWAGTPEKSSAASTAAAVSVAQAARFRLCRQMRRPNWRGSPHTLEEQEYGGSALAVQSGSNNFTNESNNQIF
jgi:hypothetical protein